MKLIFDFDGTLANTMPKLATAAEVLISSTYDISRAEAYFEYMNTIGLSFPAQLEWMFPKDPLNKTTAVKFLEQQKKIYDEVGFHDGSFEELKLLEYLNIPYAIVSSSVTELIYEFFKKRNLEVPYPTLGHDWGPKKDQLVYLKSLGYTTFIGDAPKDGELANDVDVTFIGVEYTLPRPRFSGLGFDSEPDLHSAISRALEGSLSGSKQYPRNLQNAYDYATLGPY